jgi:3-phosphoshikimate 1-carboxyvinyltransferase
MAAPSARDPIDIVVQGSLVSRPYVEMTIRQMAWWGLRVEQPAPDAFRVMPQTPLPQEAAVVEADASAASYFLATAAITQGLVVIPTLSTDSLQGDVRFVDLLSDMGCYLRADRLMTMVGKGEPLRGIDVDMNAISDTVMTLAAVACFADGPTTIRNVAHIRHKETDRLAALATELRRLGAEVDEFADGLTITPRPLHGAEVETYDDHRMAMSMALIGLRVPGVIIKNPGCVAKTYPGFWDDLEKLRT